MTRADDASGSIARRTARLAPVRPRTGWSRSARSASATPRSPRASRRAARPGRRGRRSASARARTARSSPASATSSRAPIARWRRRRAGPIAARTLGMLAALGGPGVRGAHRRGAGRGRGGYRRSCWTDSPPAWPRWSRSDGAGGRGAPDRRPAQPGARARRRAHGRSAASRCSICGSARARERGRASRPGCCSTR